MRDWNTDGVPLCAAVAEVVMGFHVSDQRTTARVLFPNLVLGAQNCWLYRNPGDITFGNTDEERQWRPDIDWLAFGQVVERVEALGLRWNWFKIREVSGVAFEAEIFPEELRDYEEDEILPFAHSTNRFVAFLRAAGKAVEVIQA